jgi:hypothetical protein
MKCAVVTNTTDPSILPHASPGQDDAPLMALKVEFDRLHAERAPLYEEQERTAALAAAELSDDPAPGRVESAWKATGRDDAIAALNAVDDRLHALAQEIIETPAVSPSAFALKARVLAFALGVEAQSCDRLGDVEWSDEIVCRFVEAARRDAAAA